MRSPQIAPTYSSSFLEVERPSPLSDNLIENTIQDILSGKLDRDISDKIYLDFKKEMQHWLLSSKINDIKGLAEFDRVDIINGCTQFINNIYMQGPVQTIDGDYRYHQRLGLGSITSVGNLKPKVPLILAMPFPSTGSPHLQLSDILNECLEKDIPVHIDGAWATCCRDVSFDALHPSIKSIGISLSKGLGLGWNRIGLRWTRHQVNDSVTIMNDFHMNNRALVMIGLHFVRNFPIDYLWSNHGSRYYRVCEDFDLEPTKSIYLALRNGQPVGVSPLIRHLENAEYTY
jgi:hypothetical protein